MSRWLEVITAVVAFSTTNVDDFVVLTVLFATSGRGGPSRRDIVMGQYAGIAALVAGSALAATLLIAVPDRWIGLLGLVPLLLGVRGLVWAARNPGVDGGDEVAVPVRGALGVAAVTVANGADNVSVYTPLLRQGAGADRVVLVVLVFAVMVGLWLVAASAVAGRRTVIDLVDRTGHWLVPVVFIAIGLAIILSSGLVSGSG